MTNKIFNKLFWARCIKREINYKDKRFIIYEMKTSPASINFGNIIVTQEFFKTFSKKEQLAILYHEEYHKNITTLFKKIFYSFRFFLNIKKISWQEEFDADKYATNIIGKDAVKSFLKKSELLYKKGIVAYNPKTHPSIKERIKNIEKVK